MRSQLASFSLPECSAQSNHALMQSVLLSQVQYQKYSDLYKIANSEGDIHAVDFLANATRAVVRALAC